MRKIALVCIIGLSLLIFTASQVFAAEMTVKIGLVDLNRAVNESAQGKKAKSELEAVIKQKQEALDEKGRALDKLKSDIDKQGSAMAAEAQKSKENDLERLTREYQRALAESQNEVRKKETELTGQIVKDLRETIKVVALEEKYDLIVDNNPALVFFADKGFDITDKVIKKFDQSKEKSANK
ncbi:MAG: OmpH family outer membrane protein [Dissulfurispiraceae bacterium]